MNDPEVTVIIPVRNRAEDLARCLAAIAEQDFPHSRFEVIVCDDGSDEDLRPVVATAARTGLNVSYLRQTPKGPAAARNLGIRRARALIVAMTDSDALPDRVWLKKLIEALTANPNAAAVEGKVISGNAGEFDPLGDGPTNLAGGVYLTCNCAYRRDVLLKIGGFDESFPYPAYEDTELAARAQEFGEIVWQPEAVVTHPQRPLTLRAVLNKLRHWDYVLLMGYRYGYLAWRKYPVKHPRLRVTALSVAALPLAKFRTALQWLNRKPGAALKLMGFGLIEAGGALLLVAPKVLFGSYRAGIERKHYLKPDAS